MVAMVRQAIDLSNLVTAAHKATDLAFKLAAAAFKFHLAERHPEITATDWLSVTTAIEIDIAEANGARFLFNGATARPNSPALILAMIAITAIIGMVGSIADTIRTGIVIDTTKLGLDRDCRAACLTPRPIMIGKGGRCDEQGRRNGKRGCSRGHDTLYHDASKTQRFATCSERYVSGIFI